MSCDSIFDYHMMTGPTQEEAEHRSAESFDSALNDYIDKGELFFAPDTSSDDCETWGQSLTGISPPASRTMDSIL